MSKHTGYLEACLAMTIHHVEGHKATLFAFGTGSVPVEVVEYRFALVRNNLAPVLALVEKIREAARHNDIDGVREALNTKLEFGHNFGATEDSTSCI